MAISHTIALDAVDEALLESLADRCGVPADELVVVLVQGALEGISLACADAVDAPVLDS